MRARVRAVSSECARACTHVRAYEGDRPTEIKSTSGRARGERPRSAYLLLLARRGAGEPAGESHLSAHASSYPFPPFCLSLALSIPLALTRVSQSSSSVYLAPRYLLFFLALYLSHSPSLSFGGLLPVPRVHYLSFFSTSSVLPSYKWRSPSLAVSCSTVSCSSDECSFR